MSRNADLIAGFLVFYAIAGCGDDGGSGSRHGVAGNKKVNTLDQLELDKICGDARVRSVDTATAMARDRGYLQGTCTAFGLVAAYYNGGTIDKCENARDQCITVASQSSVDAGLSTVGCPTAIAFSQCEALVADIDACTSEALGAIQQQADQVSVSVEGLSCANAGKPIDAGWLSASGTISIGSLSTLPKCSSLFQQCPSAALLY
jgi:hypothetical protein